MWLVEIEYNDDRLDESGLLISESEDEIVFEDNGGNVVDVDREAICFIWYVEEL